MDNGRKQFFVFGGKRLRPLFGMVSEPPEFATEILNPTLDSL